MTPPPRKYADAPGTASRVAEMRPPAEDSATARVCLRSLSNAPSAAAMERSFGMAESIARSARQRRPALTVDRRAERRDDERHHAGETGEDRPRCAVRVERLEHQAEDRRAGEQADHDRRERHAAQQPGLRGAPGLGADDEVDADPAVGADAGEEGEQRGAERIRRD